jgi:hypothetical protein
MCPDQPCDDRIARPVCVNGECESVRPCCLDVAGSKSVGSLLAERYDSGSYIIGHLRHIWVIHVEDGDTVWAQARHKARFLRSNGLKTVKVFAVFCGDLRDYDDVGLDHERRFPHAPRHVDSNFDDGELG